MTSSGFLRQGDFTGFVFLRLALMPADSWRFHLYIDGACHAVLVEALPYGCIAPDVLYDPVFLLGCEMSSRSLIGLFRGVVMPPFSPHKDWHICPI